MTTSTQPAGVFAPLAAPILAAYPELSAEDIEFAAPPNMDLADVAVRLFVAARKLGTAPAKLAADIAQKIDFGGAVIEAATAGPYLNLRLDRPRFAKAIIGAIHSQGDRFGSKHSGAGQKVLVEHTSINPNASPHVGRARNAMIGDSLVRMLRFEDYEVEVQYYVNDMGRQIALLALVCEDPSRKSFEEMLQLYVEANERALTEPDFAAKGYELLAKMEEGDQATRDHFFAITELCLHGQLMVLARLGVNYDVFVRESKFVKDPRFEPLLDQLREREAVFVDDDERLVVDLQKLGHEPEEGRFFVLMRANGSSLYGYRDLAYTMDKADQAADLNLIVLGEDHKLYLQQLGLILSVAGKTAPEPVYYAYILLREGKMSTRQGKVVLLSEFLDEATKRAGEKVALQCIDLTPSEQQRIAAKVAVAAIRFAILRTSPTKNVIFDWDTSLSFSGDTGPYVQYSCARIASILRKFGELPAETPTDLPLDHDAEWALMLKLSDFPSVVSVAVEQRSATGIAQFALETARHFTHFYHECPVLNAESEAQRTARAALCQATFQTLRNALFLLGIEALDRM